MIDPLVLSAGSHHRPRDGQCLMELVSMLAGEQFSDHPHCASPLITALAIAINDVIPGDEERTRWLAPLAEGIVGTRAEPAIEKIRTYACADAAIRRFAPLLLETLGLEREGARLRLLPAVQSRESGCVAARAASEFRPLLPREGGAVISAASTLATDAERLPPELAGAATARVIRATAYAMAVLRHTEARPALWAESAALLRTLVESDASRLAGMRRPVHACGAAARPSRSRPARYWRAPGTER